MYLRRVMQESIIAVSAAVGALSLSMLGWLKSGEAFQFRKFVGSAITAIVAGVGVAVTYNYGQGVTVIGVMGAFLTGMGADAGRKAIAKISIPKQ